MNDTPCFSSYDSCAQSRNTRPSEILASRHPIKTPAFVIDEHRLRVTAVRFTGRAFQSLFSVKALSVPTVIAFIGSILKGISASSCNEAALARNVAPAASLHWVSSLLRFEDLDRVIQLCDRVTLNSPTLIKSAAQLGAKSIGLRVNPKYSVAEDEKYDPCRRNSRLGIPIDYFREMLDARDDFLDPVQGIHVHNACDCSDHSKWIDTMRHVEKALGDHLHRFSWFNVGGGYYLDRPGSIEEVSAELERLGKTYGLEMIIEPGAGIVRSAGSFIATVCDIVEGDDYPIAILDLSVNHWPEVFEYQFEPDVEWHRDGAPHQYQLAGCSCLAGDIFGVYSFDEPLEIGSRVVFQNAGAYSIVKAHMFNGIDLPSIYLIKESGEVELVKEFGYDDFLMRSGADPSAVI